MTERVDILDAPSWLLQPSDRIVASVVEEIRREPVFVSIFGEAIEPYLRMDFGVRDLPAIRVHSPTGRKDGETWYFTGEVKADVIFPPSVRRAQLQGYPDIVCAALLAQFRRQPFFEAVRAKVPGLNQLGWSFSFDKSLGFVAKEGDEICPLTQLVINYRVNLNEWDEYLESTDRTTDDPFERTLGDLERIVATAQTLLDDGTSVSTPADVFNVKVK